MKKAKQQEVNNDENGVKKAAETVVRITPPNMSSGAFLLDGKDSFLSVNRMTEKARNEIMSKQRAGSQAKSKVIRTPKDFEGLAEAAAYRSAEGWCGIHSAAFRCAMISACRLVGFKMVLAKLSIFVIADGYDKRDKTPLVRIWGPEPEVWTAPVSNASGGFDLRPRPRWNPGEWQISLKLSWDADQFSTGDITNLLMRVGKQVGIGEGRPDSKKSAGLAGYGLFDVMPTAVEVAA